MCARIKRPRKILNPPSVKGFKPYGLNPVIKKTDSINILYEEYEALRLVDYDHLNHQQSSLMMDVSRPTFTRIYAAALQKIATAFVEGRQIAIEGGKVYFDSDWHQCNMCECYFNHPHKDIPINECPLCGSSEITDFDFSEEREDAHNYEDKCICPQCNFEQSHQRGKPCNEEVCPQCGHYMKRVGGHGNGGNKRQSI